MEKEIKDVLESLRKTNKNLYEYWCDELEFPDNWNQYTLYRMRQGLDSFRILNSI